MSVVRKRPCGSRSKDASAYVLSLPGTQPSLGIVAGPAGGITTPDHGAIELHAGGIAAPGSDSPVAAPIRLASQPLPFRQALQGRTGRLGRGRRAWVTGPARSIALPRSDGAEANLGSVSTPQRIPIGDRRNIASEGFGWRLSLSPPGKDGEHPQQHKHEGRPRSAPPPAGLARSLATPPQRDDVRSATEIHMMTLSAKSGPASK